MSIPPSLSSSPMSGAFTTTMSASAEGLLIPLGMIFFWGLVSFGVSTLFRGGLGARTRDSDDSGELALET